MGKDYFIWFNLITIVFLIINMGCYLKSFARKSKAFKIFTIYLVSMSIIQVSSTFLGKILHQENLFLSHYFFIAQFLFLSLFYKELLKSKYIIGVLIFGLIYIIYQYFDDPNLYFKYNAIGITITQSIIVIYTIIYFYKSLAINNKFIVINIGVFLYLTSSTLIFASGNLIFNLKISEAMNYLLININRILYFVFQILIFIEWRKNYYKKTLKSL